MALIPALYSAELSVETVARLQLRVYACCGDAGELLTEGSFAFRVDGRRW
jgi:hypothetical protein